MDEDSEIVEAILKAWNNPTTWEEFGRAVSAILASHGMYNSKREGE